MIRNYEMKSSRFALRIFAYVFFILAVVFYAVQFWGYRDQIPDVAIETSSYVVMFFCLLLIVVISGLGGAIWYLLLRDHNISVRLGAAVGIFFIAQFGKYLPGNIGHHVGRIVMARQAGIPGSVVLNTMLTELLLGMGMLTGMVMLSIALFVDIQAYGMFPQFGVLQLGLCMVALLCMPWLGIGVLNRYLPRLARRLSGGGAIVAPSLRTALLSSALFLLSFMIMGLVLKLQARWFFDVTAGGVFELTCLFAVAWLAGYLVPGAPGGLGVREAMMVLVLSPVLGAGTAVALGVTLRVTTTLGDAIVFVLGVSWRKYMAVMSARSL